jgi:hypothetical protein
VFAVTDENHENVWAPDFQTRTEAEQTPGPNAAGRIRQIEKKFIHLIASGTYDLPACSTMP